MRIRTVVQLHTVNRMQAFGWPLFIMSASLVLVLVIGGLVLNVGGPAAREGMHNGMQFNGAIFALLGPLIGFGFTAMGQYFPLSLGLGLTRREFAAGTLLVFVGNALFYAVVVTLGKVLEVATGGFGTGIRFFDTYFTGIGPWWHTLVQTFLMILAVMLVGSAITTAFHRWGQSFLWVFWISLAVVVVAVLAGLMLAQPVRDAFAALGGMPWGGWMALVAVIGAIGGAIWLALLRRAQAR